MTARKVDSDAPAVVAALVDRVDAQLRDLARVESQREGELVNIAKTEKQRGRRRVLAATADHHAARAEQAQALAKAVRSAKSKMRTDLARLTEVATRPR